MTYNVEYKGKKYKVVFKAVAIAEYMDGVESGRYSQVIKSLKRLIPDLPWEDVEYDELKELNKQLQDIIVKKVKEARGQD